MRSGFDPDLFEPFADVEERSFWFRARNRLIVSRSGATSPTRARSSRSAAAAGSCSSGCGRRFPSCAWSASSSTRRVSPSRGAGSPTWSWSSSTRGTSPTRASSTSSAPSTCSSTWTTTSRCSRRWCARLDRAAACVLLVPQHRWLWSEHDEIVEHRRRYTRKELLAKAERAGLEVVEVDVVRDFAPAGDGRLAGGRPRTQEDRPDREPRSRAR